MISSVRDALVALFVALSCETYPKLFEFVDGRLPMKLSKLPAAVVRFSGGGQEIVETGGIAERDLVFRVHLYFDLIAGWDKAEDRFEAAIEALFDSLLDDDSLGGLAESVSVEVDDSEPVVDLERGALWKVAILRVKTEAG